jgi:hypothetical protein
MNESFHKVPDMIVILFAFLFVSFGPSKLCSIKNFGGPWRAIATDFETFEEKKTKKLLTMRGGC